MNIKTIQSLQNPLVKHLTKLVSHRKYRHECKSVVIEGQVLIQELHHTMRIKAIVTVDEKLIPPSCDCTDIYLVNDSILGKISGTKTPEGIIAEVEIPLFNSLEGKKWIVAFDAVQDPGNLGTLLRTALAFDWDGAFLLDGCCDPWNDKAVRAAKGATFKLPIINGTWDELKVLAKKNNCVPLAADLDGKPPENVECRDGILLVLGSEGQGLSKEAKEFCKKVSIPMHGEMESLNVSIAGGILMYTLKKENHE